MSSQENTILHFVTWNTNGIRSPPEKFSNVLSSLSDLHADIVFIQETHVGPNSYHILTDVEDWKVYFTVHRRSSKGVAILIKNSVPFKYICHDEDCSGGYIVLFCHLYGELYTFVNVYNHKGDRFFLTRLKEYLMETAEGVLVVGGDFNTVLHPCFDRKPSAVKHSPFRDILEDFIVSLNVRDTWSYLHPAEEEFTRHQNESHSRIDMFFMRNDTMGRVCGIRVSRNDISDHDPLVLELRAQQQAVNIIPKVASFLDEFGYDGEPDRSCGKISGAEILSAIQVLADSEEQRPDQLPVRHYKRFQHPMSEILKINYNLMLKMNSLSLDRRIFNVEYLIFSQILAKRLSANMFPNLKKMTKTNLDKFLTVTFEKDTQKVKLSFLDPSRLDNNLKKKLSPFDPPTKFQILEHLLPKVLRSSGKFTLLRSDCPLTSVILNLALNKLYWILNNETECRSSVCFQRQALLIHTCQSKQQQVVRIVRKFQEDSGIIFDISEEMYVTAK